MKHLDKTFPRLAQALVHDRDEALAGALLRAAGVSPEGSVVSVTASAPRIVAVVGIAHVDGILGRWKAAGGASAEST